jgi:hypothetical protein
MKTTYRLTYHRLILQTLRLYQKSRLLRGPIVFDPVALSSFHRLDLLCHKLCTALSVSNFCLSRSVALYTRTNDQAYDEKHHGKNSQSKNT